MKLTLVLAVVIAAFSLDASADEVRKVARNDQKILLKALGKYNRDVEGGTLAKVSAAVRRAQSSAPKYFICTQHEEDLEEGTRTVKTTCLFSTVTGGKLAEVSFGLDQNAYRNATVLRVDYNECNREMISKEETPYGEREFCDYDHAEAPELPKEPDLAP